MQIPASSAHEVSGSLTVRAEPQGWLPPALLGGLVSTGGEIEALLKHIMVMLTNGRGQEEGNRKVPAGTEEPCGRGEEGLSSFQVGGVSGW